MTRRIRRTLALLLALAMCFAMLPSSAFAEEDAEEIISEEAELEDAVSEESDLEEIETDDLPAEDTEEESAADVETAAEETAEDDETAEELTESISASEVETETEASAASDGSETVTWSYTNEDEHEVTVTITREQPDEETGVSTESTTTATYYTSVEEAAEYLREGLASWGDAVTFYYQQEIDDDAGTEIWDAFIEIFNEAVAHTGNPREGDYIYKNLSAESYTIKYRTLNNVCYATMIFTPTFRTTADEEAEFDEAVEDLLTELDLDGEDDYTKVKAIYDYICENVTYDYDGLADGDAMVYTAYKALMEGTSVCQGYALLFYHLALKVGVDARYVSGTANGGSHGWNIVELDDLYYYLDATWDAGDETYSYFLKGSSTFLSDHTVESDFIDDYDISETDYGIDGIDVDSVLAEGTCGDDLTWVLTGDGVLTISGTGDMDDCSSRAAPWYSYRSSILFVVIEEGVTSIGMNAFYQCTAIQEITIPEGVETIGIMGFYKCTNLNAIVLPESLTAISSDAFYNCTSLTDIYYAGSEDDWNNIEISSDYNDGLLENSSLTIHYNYHIITVLSSENGSISVSDGCVSVAGSLVACAGDTISLTVTPASVDYDLTALYVNGTEVEILDPCTFTMPDAAVVIRAVFGEETYTLTLISDGETFETVTAGYGTVIDLSAYVPEKDGYTFSGWLDEDGNAVADDFVITENTSLYADWVEIEETYTLTLISDGETFETVTAGYGTVIDLSAYVPEKDGYTFSGWLDEDGNAVADDFVITENTSLYADWVEIEVIEGTCGDDLTWVLEGTTLTISGTGDMTDWDSRSDVPWYEYRDAIVEVIFESGLTSIGKYAFYNCDNLLTVEIPDGVTTINSRAFYSCDKLTSVILPDSVTCADDCAFYKCSNLTSLTCSENLTEIGALAFHYCSGLADEDGFVIINSILCFYAGEETNITIPDTVTSIAEYGMSQISNVVSVVIPDSVTSMGNSAFYRCSNLTSVTISGGLDTISTAAFENCTSLAEVIILDDVTRISSFAFDGCSALETITIPKSLTYISSYAFYGCDSLTTVYYGGSELNWIAVSVGGYNDCLTEATIYYAEEGTTVTGTCGDDLTWVLDLDYTLTISGTGDMTDWDSYSDVAWYDYRTVIVSVVIEEGATSIGDYAFYYCNTLTSIELPQSITSIGKKAFYYCTSLVSISLSECLSVIGSYAFDYCTGLSSITIPASVTQIANYAFRGCTALTEIRFEGDVPSISSSAFKNVTATAYYPVGNDTWDSMQKDYGGSITWVPYGSVTLFLYDGEDLLESLTAEYGDTIVVADLEEPEKTGYTFSGWLDEDGNAVTEDFVITGNTSLYADWTEVEALEVDAPTIVSIYSTVQTSAKVTWTEVDGASGYQIYRSTSIDGEYTCIKTISSGNTVKYTNTGLTIGQTYYYKVRAYAKDSDGSWVYSEFSDVAYMPAAVVITNAYSNSTSRNRIVWDEVSGAEGYQLWRADSEDGTYKIVKTITSGSTTAYSNTGLESGKTYYYKMRAYTTDADGNKVFGAYSDIVAVAVTPLAPEIVSIVSTASGRAKITWDAVNGAAGYQIWRYDEDSGSYSLIKSITDGDTVSYTNSGLTSGTTYSYKIRAYTEVNGKKTFSDYSEVVSVTVQ